MKTRKTSIFYAGLLAVQVAPFAVCAQPFASVVRPVAPAGQVSDTETLRPFAADVPTPAALAITQPRAQFAEVTGRMEALSPTTPISTTAEVAAAKAAAKPVVTPPAKRQKKRQKIEVMEDGSFVIVEDTSPPPPPKKLPKLPKFVPVREKPAYVPPPPLPTEVIIPAKDNRPALKLTAKPYVDSKGQDYLRFYGSSTGKFLPQDVSVTAPKADPAPSRAPAVRWQ
ncbi:MAG: hypothetical protein WAX89_02000 [Alphaproteobacteria bacterium]